MGPHPVGDTLVMHTQMPRHAPLVHSVDIPLHRLPPHCAVMALRFGFGRVLALTRLTLVALTSSARFASPMLAFTSWAVWTFGPPNYLKPTPLATPKTPNTC